MRKTTEREQILKLNVGKKKVSEGRNINYLEDNFKAGIESMLSIDFPFCICLG